MLKTADLALRRALPEDIERVVEIQHAAYARNRDLLGVEPLPLMADYEEIFRDYEIWVSAEGPITRKSRPELCISARTRSNLSAYSAACPVVSVVSFIYTSA